MDRPCAIASVARARFALVAGDPGQPHGRHGPTREILLRGGAPAGQRNGAAAPAPGAAAAAAAKTNAADILARTTQALQSVQAMQKAASNLSHGPNNAGLNPNGGGLLPNVPNGLTPGGLVVDPGVPANPSLWQGASLPKQTTNGSQTFVSINQFSPQAVLNWQTFNVGRTTTVQFDQDAGGNQTSQWIAFNKVNDPSGLPSQILGSIQANGQVFVVNRNGIIFGGTAQVNTHAFYASSLPINGNLITSGLLANPDQQFLFSSLPIAAGPNGTPAFTPPAPYGSDYGDVTVEAGAVLSLPPPPRPTSAVGSSSSDPTSPTTAPFPHRMDRRFWPRAGKWASMPIPAPIPRCVAWMHVGAIVGTPVECSQRSWDGDQQWDHPGNRGRRDDHHRQNRAAIGGHR